MPLATRTSPTPVLRDAAGVVHPPAGTDARIVCLVPSITELLCDLGLASQLIGRTGFCIHPWDTVRTIPKLGATKDVKLERIRERRAASAPAPAARTSSSDTTTSASSWSCGATRATSGGARTT